MVLAIGHGPNRYNLHFTSKLLLLPIWAQKAGRNTPTG
jgi:hypothetical protein